MTNYFHYLEILYFDNGEYRVVLSMSLYPLETGFVNDYIWRIFINPENYKKLHKILYERYRG